MSRNAKDSIRNWLWWLFIATIMASLSLPLRYAFLPETYTKLSTGQEILVFLVEVVGLAWFVVRRFAKGMSEDENG